MGKSRGQIGLGTTIEFKTSGFTCQGTQFQFSGMGSREPQDITNFGSPQPKQDGEYGGMESIPSSPGDAGTIELQLIWDPDGPPPPWNEEPEIIVITFPLRKGYAKAAYDTGEGYLTDQGIAIPVKGVVTQTATIQKTGVWQFFRSQKVAS